MNEKHFKDSPAGEASKVSLKKYYAGKKAVEEVEAEELNEPKGHKYDAVPTYAGKTHKDLEKEGMADKDAKEAAEEEFKKLE